MATDSTSVLKSHGIALTGGIATGKSTVAALIAAAGVPVIDADQLSRSVTAPGTHGLAAIVAAFGREVLGQGGALDRRRLGAIVFADPARRRDLERILHPAIRAALLERIEALGLVAAPRPFVYEASLIFETGTAGDFKAVWATFCPEETQIARLMARDRVERPRAEDVLKSQLPAALKAARADVVIRTDVPPATLEAEVRRLASTL